MAGRKLVNYLPEGKLNFNYFRIGFMKKLILLLIPVMLIIAGCSQSILEPTAPALEVQKSVIQLPPPSSLSIENVYEVSEEIDGSRGGMVKMNESYSSGSGLVTIKAKLKIPQDAFSGTETIGYLVSGSDGSIDFSPGMSFNKDLQFDIRFTGLDLSGINPDEIHFMYMDPDGTTHPVEYSSLTVDLDRGVLEVKDAVISHFSRYIWSR
jgi:hypothetical protein